MADPPFQSKWLLIVAVTIGYLMNIGDAYPFITPSVASPWPMPQFYYAKEFVYILDVENFGYRATGYTCGILNEAFKRYAPIMVAPRKSAVKVESNMVGDSVRGVAVILKKPCSDGDFPTLESDESYNFGVFAGEIEMMANEVWGALRGLETLTQIVYEDDMGRLLLNESETRDQPRFNYRGILLDTANHFISVPVLLKNLDAMELNKFNVFHWHIVDDLSFPYESNTFPQLSQKGALDALTHVYSQSDIAAVIEYARLRGIRVLIEFDTPAHSLSWGNGQPDLLTRCYFKGQPTDQFGPINPALNTTYSFLKAFFTEVTDTFPDDWLHLGGDDVDFQCWESNPDVLAFMKEMNFTNISDLEQFYFQKLESITTSFRKKNVVWQDVYDEGVKLSTADTIYQIWLDGWQTEMYKMTDDGYNTILSSCWNLDKIQTPSLYDWMTYYSCEPYDFKGSESQKNLVLGGEASLSGEFVDDTNLISRLWPRASAVGERLWSAMDVNNITAANPRITENHCRMAGRGISAEPLGPGYCQKEFHAPIATTD